MVVMRGLSAPPSSGDRLMDIVRTQSFAGAFVLTDALAVACGAPSAASVRAAVPGLSDAASGTALVLALFETVLAGRETEWRMVARKARAELLRELGGAADAVERALAALRAIVR